MRRFVLFLLIFFAFTAPTLAQNIQLCTGFDTANFSTTQLPVLGTCNVTTGPAGVIFVTNNSETTCTTSSTEGFQLYVAPGTSPVNGSNFTASTSGNVLTVATLVNAFGNGSIQGTSIISGTGGITGTYTSVPITGGTGGSAVATIKVSNGGVTSIQITTPGTSYAINDVVSAASANIGNTTGFSALVTALGASNGLTSAGTQQISGSGGTTGTYNAVALTGGNGLDAKCNCHVAGGGVYQVDSIAGFGNAYQVGDLLSANSTNIGNTTGFSEVITAVTSTSNWLVLPGQILTGATLNKNTATILSQQSSPYPDNATGMRGTYLLSDAVTMTPGQAIYTIGTLPGGLTAMSKLVHQNGCSPNFLITAVGGAFLGQPNTNYWIAWTIQPDADGHLASQNNNSVTVLTY